MTAVRVRWRVPRRLPATRWTVSCLAAMHPLLQDAERRHPESVVHRGGEIFLSVGVATEVVSDAQRQHIPVLGLEAVLISDADTFPALSRIADFSRTTRHGTDLADWSAAQALSLLNGAWKQPPIPGEQEQLAFDAHGRYMVAIVLSSVE